MSRITIKKAKEQKTGQVSIAGFVQNLRLHKNIAFIDLRDESAVMQLVLEETNLDFSEVKKITLESVIAVSGTLKEKPSKKNEEKGEADYELLVNSLEIYSLASENLAISVLNKADNEAGVEARFNYRWLDLRQKDKQLIFKVWTILEAAFRTELIERNFTQIHSPCFMSTASESGAEVFKVKYFDREAYLAQSPQFYKQMAMASGFEKVFSFGPVFRAEPSFTSRHLTEFIGWDFELSYINSHFDIMKLEEEVISKSFAKLKQELDLDINVPKLPFPKISIKEAKEKLAKKNIDSEKDDDLSPEEERGISKIVKEELDSDFVFITDYPISARPFYHMRYEDKPNLTKSFDLLYKGIEITTGSQREHRLDILEKQAKEKGIDISEIKNYLDFFRYGCPPHGGVGIGPARIIMKLLNYDNVKEVCFLPRDVRRLTP